VVARHGRIGERHRRAAGTADEVSAGPEPDRAAGVRASGDEDLHARVSAHHRITRHADHPGEPPDAP
jgi:hypothetical protein